MCRIDLYAPWIVDCAQLSPIVVSLISYIYIRSGGNSKKKKKRTVGGTRRGWRRCYLKWVEWKKRIKESWWNDFLPIEYLFFLCVCVCASLLMQLTLFRTTNTWKRRDLKRVVESFYWPCTFSFFFDVLHFAMRLPRSHGIFWFEFLCHFRSCWKWELTTTAFSFDYMRSGLDLYRRCTNQVAVHHQWRHI